VKHEGRPHHEGLLVIDFGSQYTLLIARRLREQQVYCEVISREDASHGPPEGFLLKGIILSGGPDTANDTHSRSLPSWVMTSSVPVLGICYGLQLMVRHFGGTLRSLCAREYGRSHLTLEDWVATSDLAPLWQNHPKEHVVWMSHGDDIDKMPDDFEIMARTQRSVAAIVSKNRRFMALQYHPEVEHTHLGSQWLKNFVQHMCGITAPWNAGSLLTELLASILQHVKTGKVCVACSGGVDSTVTLSLLTRALGADRVQGLFVNTGLLRWKEAERIQKTLAEIGMNIKVIAAQKTFFDALKGMSDPEQKRKVIGATFVDVFADYADHHQEDYTYLAQGTLYSDVIESGGSVGETIKSHHNVGGLPDKVPFKIIEPLRYLFKDEVRALGKELGIPDHVLWQHPFPGPGLGVRIPGEISAEKVMMLQQADHIFISALKEKGYYDEVWQAFAVHLPVKSVGVMGDGRTYEWVVSLRAVLASDAMTAEVAPLPMSFLTEVAANIVSSVPGINRVLYDITTKPPATIEWE